jgi:hypothetical protein
MKSRSIFAVGICFLLAAGMFGLVSCGSSATKGTAEPEKTQASADASSQAAAKAPEAQVAPAGNGGWLEGIPATVPPFTYGTFDAKESSAFTGDSGNSTMYSLYYEGVTLEQVEEYAVQLKAAGFQVQEENARPGDKNISGFLPQGEGRIGFSLGFQASGHVDLTFNVVKKYE